MTQTDYEQKKRECWKEFNNAVFNGNTSYSPYGALNFAFDRAYSLGKQEKDAEGEEMLTVKAKVVREIYAYNEDILSLDSTHSGAILLRKKLQELFGSKCLSNEPSPEPKFNDGDLVRRKSTDRIGELHRMAPLGYYFMYYETPYRITFESLDDLEDIELLD